jgi:thioredoxin 1
MKKPIIIFQLLLIVSLTGSLNLLAKEKGGVTEITNQVELNANFPAVLEFYSKNCGACSMFKKQYERIAKKHPTINFLKIDGVQNHDLLTKYQITAFPSFIFIANGTITNPKIVVGPKRHEIEVAVKELLDQVQNATTPTKSGPSKIKTVASLAEFEKLVRDTDKLVVAEYQANWCGACKMFAPKFLEIADQYQDVAIFVQLNDETPQGKEFAKKHNLSSMPRTMVFKDKQPNTPVATIVGGDKEKLIREIKQASAKLNPNQKNVVTDVSIEIVEIKNKAQFDELIQKSSMPVIIDYHAESWCGACQVYKDIFAAFPKQFPKLKFVKVDGHLAENRTIGDTYNIQKLPTTLIFENGKKTQAIEGISPELNQILKTLNAKS